MLKLQFKDQRQPPVWLVESVTTIGSDPKNHIVIKEEGVEPQHAEIRKDGDALYLTDLGSFRGTSVNGSKIKANFQLRSGDAIQVASVELMILDPQQGATDKKEALSPRSEWTIMALSGPLKGKSIPIHGSMVFGRSSSCDIQISDAHMSRRHAEINLKQGVLRLVDLQSSNGTCVNGKTIGEQVLKPGDKISFDHLTFLVAGPLGAGAAVPEEEDDDEATVFRAAPIPRAPTPPKPAATSLPKTNAKVEQAVSAPPPKSNVGMIIGGIVLVLAIAGGGVFMLLQG
ncbi:FHA domain-containing protein [Ketobacter sp.]|uniref:FHA domain-containing protein n=1 Tax=Ketobacter sp. TaxID=2083498 RepID=UPI000F14063B|nr:FHA domain-containing protein [Ketobacter sp.]RLT94511.1 MAG: FHA domain-containing protein [Ketobacter sp.]